MQAHAEHLLDLFLGLRGTYAMLDPILFDRVVIDRWGSGKKGPGLQILINALLQACVLGIAKIALDDDPRTPSISKLVAALEDSGLAAELRHAYAVWRLPPTDEDRPEVRAILKKMEQDEEQKRREQFDELVGKMRTGWDQLRDSPSLAGFSKMRDKLIAHSELWHDGKTYRPLDVASLGLKFGDLREVITRLETLVDQINLIYRNSSFAFDALDEQLTATKNHFWLPMHPSQAAV